MNLQCRWELGPIKTFPTLNGGDPARTALEFRRGNKKFAEVRDRIILISRISNHVIKSFPVSNAWFLAKQVRLYSRDFHWTLNHVLNHNCESSVFLGIRADENIPHI